MGECLLESHVFTVERRIFEQNGEAPVERDVVVHPGAVTILPVIDVQNILMIRNFRYSVEQELWELPAGTREEGETPIETAKRELIEEAGYRAGQMEPLSEFYTSPGICTERMHAFVARDLTEVGQDLQGDERIVVEQVSLQEARRMLLAGEILDGKTIAVLGTYLLQVKQEAMN